MIDGSARDWFVEIPLWFWVGYLGGWVTLSVLWGWWNKTPKRPFVWGGVSLLAGVLATLVLYIILGLTAAKLDMYNTSGYEWLVWLSHTTTGVASLYVGYEILMSLAKSYHGGLHGR